MVIVEPVEQEIVLAEVCPTSQIKLSFANIVRTLVAAKISPAATRARIRASYVEW